MAEAIEAVEIEEALEAAGVAAATEAVEAAEAAEPPATQVELLVQLKEAARHRPLKPLAHAFLGLAAVASHTSPFNTEGRAALQLIGRVIVTRGGSKEVPERGVQTLPGLGLHLRKPAAGTEEQWGCRWASMLGGYDAEATARAMLKEGQVRNFLKSTQGLGQARQPASPGLFCHLAPRRPAPPPSASPPSPR